jgi:hypothetical protein
MPDGNYNFYIRNEDAFNATMFEVNKTDIAFYKDENETSNEVFVSLVVNHNGKRGKLIIRFTFETAITLGVQLTILKYKPLHWVKHKMKPVLATNDMVLNNLKKRNAHK